MHSTDAYCLMHSTDAYRLMHSTDAYRLMHSTDAYRLMHSTVFHCTNLYRQLVICFITSYSHGYTF